MYSIVRNVDLRSGGSSDMSAVRLPLWNLRCRLRYCISPAELPLLTNPDVSTSRTMLTIVHRHYLARRQRRKHYLTGGEQVIGIRP
ncbi:hypothetical protein M404DRAFT_993432 [Pisolithus tinctorius Marx 270]|uniref:Uncharacterized protein n=1 Tax=Pisolithus tinctorius Marx 270 TaxID=870435 RepID=A0A0C3PUG1_PISTI|nr:hypothetical protein M404DRAFT_993432 [Pisolithus tinctorius Marx 270]